MKVLVEVEEAVELLSRTPALLDLWLVGLPEAWLRSDEGEGTYNAIDVVAHLLHSEETDWYPRLERMLEHGEAVPFDPFERDAFRDRFKDWPLERLLPRFSSARRENLEKLSELRLRPVDLNRTGMHPALGRVTLAQLLAAWQVHDLTHLAQVARVMAKRHTETVGPWRRYLRVLDDRPR
jgi:hypothetical protein